MSNNNFLPFPVQEGAHIQEKFPRRQALDMPMVTVNHPFGAYQNPYNSMLSAPHRRAPLNRNRFLGVRNNNNPLIQKLHQFHVWMRMARRFGINANRAAARAPYFRSRVLVITRQLPVINHQAPVDSANIRTHFQANNSTSNLLERSGVEINNGHEEEKFQDMEEEEPDGLDLRLKL